MEVSSPSHPSSSFLPCTPLHKEGSCPPTLEKRAVEPFSGQQEAGRTAAAVQNRQTGCEMSETEDLAVLRGVLSPAALQAKVLNMDLRFMLKNDFFGSNPENKVTHNHRKFTDREEETFSNEPPQLYPNTY